MMSYDDQYFDPVVYKASIVRQWDGASALSRATVSLGPERLVELRWLTIFPQAVNDAVRWMEVKIPAKLCD